MNSERAGRVLWEPFCGGLSMTAELAKAGPLVASDAHPGLIALYEKMRAEPDWLEGFECSEADYQAAKRLPDNDPAKAFIGFGCSFGGKWFGGYARFSAARGGPSTCVSSIRTLARKIEATHAAVFACGSFFEQEPRADMLLYCDPPYAGTTGYSGVRAFNQETFRARCLAWRDAGSIVYISEYENPIGSLVWEREQGSWLGVGVKKSGARVKERLYRLGP